MKVGEKRNFGRLATMFQICSMDADFLYEEATVDCEVALHDTPLTGHESNYLVFLGIKKKF